MRFIENKTFDEIAVGDSAEIVRRLRADDIELFAVMSGDVNPAHVDEEFARSGRFHRVIAHGMWGGALISAVLGAELPGPGTVYLEQSLRFHHPVGVGDTVTVRVTAREKRPKSRRILFDCLCLNQDGEEVITGEALVIAPDEKVRRPRVALPEVRLHERGARFQELIDATRPIAPLRAAVVHPCDPLSLGGALEAADQGVIEPILVGPEHKIRAAAEAAERDLADVEIVAVPHSHAAAEKAVALVRSGRAEGLMKGSLHTDEFMGAILPGKAGLRTERRMSHVYALDVPHYPKPLFITDAAINIAPGLEDHRDIIQNAIDLALALEVDAPKVAILSAVESVTPKIPSTVTAAALCKMADRGQITGGLLDGPLAFDNAVSPEAARAKGIASRVAGQADILLAPDLETGNMLAKQLIHLAGAEAAGIVLGARAPIMLTSRSDNSLARQASCALALLFARRTARPAQTA
ncbi:MAG: bifunctional enoyl-CoA hydratase/phosphate acetyltransferase [Caulobacterales bacterium]|nr:bifunctional enoyl-CoA hydratase/phosphate acetyltransferase [Caulobacterales bacterium]